MQAFILAAGRGERMRPLTDHTPKPLLKVSGKCLIEWHLYALTRAGFSEVVINLAYLGEQIEAALADGSRYGLTISYSNEKPYGGARETAGAVALALQTGILRPSPFLLMAADIFCPTFNFADTHDVLKDKNLWGQPLKDPDLGWLYLVKNPPHHLQGDFGLAQFVVTDGESLRHQDQRFTYSGIGVFRPELFANTVSGDKVALKKVLEPAIKAGRIGGELFNGKWSDVGTVERLALLQEN